MMKEKTILEFLLGLRDHTNEGSAYLESVLTETATATETTEANLATIASEATEATGAEDSEEREEPAEKREEPAEKREKPEEEEESAGEEPLPADFAGSLRDSLKILDGYRAGKEPLPDEWQGAFAMLFAMTADLARGIITPATAETLLKASGYERSMMMSRREGEVAGRNVRIEEELRTPRKSDGVPSLQGTGNASSVKRTRSIFDLADQAR